jgi:hypothetical protein
MLRRRACRDPGDGNLRAWLLRWGGPFNRSDGTEIQSAAVLLVDPLRPMLRLLRATQG